MNHFPGFFLAGFEAAGQRLRQGTRFDLAVTTQHDRYYELDYARLRVRGLRTVREDARWHVMETRPWHYDFATVRPMIAAARDLGITVIWSLLDRGWPEDLDPMRPAFVRRFSAFGRAFAKLLRDEGCDAPIIVPINEITSLAWLGGEMGRMDPYAEERGFEFLCQLVRAAVAAADAVRNVSPAAQIACVEPLFHVAADSRRPEDFDAALTAASRRFRTLDMLTGRAWPQLGGEDRHVDIAGLTFYPESEWYYNGPKHPGPRIQWRGKDWQPLRSLLREFADRYARPIFLAGTGCDGALAPAWLRDAAREVRTALTADVPIVGFCLNPAVDAPRLPGERRAGTGLWSAAGPGGQRCPNDALLDEVSVQQALFERLAQSIAAGADKAEATLLKNGV